MAYHDDYDNTDNDAYEEELDTVEQDICKLTDEVISAIGLKHPIIYGAYNICELSKNSKLGEFSINMLKEVCAALELDVSHITIRRKKPYLELIKKLVEGCRCFGI